MLGLALPDLPGRVRDMVPVYGSGGFTSYDDDQLTRQPRRWVGHELERTRSARATMGPEPALYVDVNGAYGRKQAVRYLRAVADCDVTWFEEPAAPMTSTCAPYLHALSPRRRRTYGTWNGSTTTFGSSTYCFAARRRSPEERYGRAQIGHGLTLDADAAEPFRVRA